MINRKQALYNLTESDDKNFMSLMCDKADKAILTDRKMYSRFLSPRERYLVEERISGDVNTDFFGGFPEAERTVVCFSSPTCYETDFDYGIDALKIFTKNKAVFSHRDYLGSVLSLGIKRELLGDIIIFDTYALVFCHREITDYILYNLEKIGRANVMVEIAQSGSLNIPEKKFCEKSLTVTSMRLDCVVSAAINKSRTVTSSFIEKGLVSVNYEEAASQTMKINDGDIISVKGFGKMIVMSDGALTKKGRYHINIKEYI